MVMRIVSCLFLAAWIGGVVHAGENAAPTLRSVEQLPIDRFDEYQAGALPPYPWQSATPSADGVSAVLDAEAESPFCGNKVTGKGFLLNDTSATAGAGAGLVNRFAPPPDKPLFLGFEFFFAKPAGDDPVGLDPVCRLLGADGKGLVFHLGRDGALSLENADGKLQRLATFEPDTWNHVGLRLDGNQLAATVVDIRGAAPNPYQVQIRDGKKVYKATAEIPLPPAGGFRRVEFVSSAPDAAQGRWMLDNVIMAGDVGVDRAPWFPFDQPSTAALRAVEKKIFIYYFPIYGTAQDNTDPGFGWYTRTMFNPTHLTKPDRAKAGTELLYRPLPRAPMADGIDKEEMRVLAMMEEVRLAIRMGVDGFLVDFQSHPAEKGGQLHFTNQAFHMMEAAKRVDPGFKIIPAVYSSVSKNGVNGEADEGRDPVDYVNSPFVQRILKHPSLLKTDDGRIVWSMWLTERHSADWWKKVMAEFEKNGTPIALLAQFNSYGQLKNFSELCYGMAHWGPRDPKPFGWVEKARPLTKVVVAPVSPHDVRTRGQMSWESQNLAALRAMWQEAIDKKADWVMMNTWCDYTEQALAPSTHIGFVPYDLGAYYGTWFKTGQQPPILRDRLYYSYRRHHTDVDPGKGERWRTNVKGVEFVNEIELLAFLARPGTLSIEVAGEVKTMDAPAGITSFRVPLPKDKAFTPAFALSRDGQRVLGDKGRYAVMDKVEFPHMLYCSGTIAANE